MEAARPNVPFRYGQASPDPRKRSGRG